MSNKAAVITGPKARPLVVQDAPMPTPEADQVVIKISAVAINPVDVLIQKLGFLIEQYPSVLGSDMAGEITAIGADVKHLKVGDRVLATGDLVKGQTFMNGSFQYYTATHQGLVAKIPASIPYTNACVLPLAMATAATALFDKGCMGLELPRHDASSTGSTLIIWGGASSVGSCGIQAARAAGYDVITTSSKKNFDYCRSLGVKEVFDYTEADVVDKIVKYMQGKQSAGVFDAVMPPDTIMACNEIARRTAGHKHVGTVVAMATQLPEGRPEEVTTSATWGVALKDNEVGVAIFEHWIPQALADGSLQCRPAPRVVGSGLDKIQHAMDTWAQGASAEKIVVEMPQ